MTRRTHARFVTGDLGTLLAIEQGGQILANEAGADINRMARAGQAKSEGRHYVEVLIYGSGTIANSVSVGIATATASLSTYVGGDAESYGYRAGEGAIHHNGAATVTGLDALVDGDIVRVELDLASDPQILRFWLNGTHQTDVDLGTSPGAGETWHLAVSLAGTNDSDLRAFLNAGQRAFEYEDDRLAGWYSLSAGIPQLRLSSAPYMTASSDSPPNTAYLDVLDPAGLTIEREVRHWPSGSVVATANISELPAINTDGELDALVTEDVRDTPIWILSLEEGAAFSTAVREFTGVVDKVRSAGDGRLMIAMRDPIATLDQPLQRKLFPPNAEASANEPLPVGLGAVRTIEPVLVDQDSNRYRFTDAPVSSLGPVRDEGKLLDPDAGTPEYTLTADRQHIELLDPPNGKLTVEFSSLGDAATEGQADLWGGIGDPFDDSDANDEPDGWDRIGSDDGTTDPAMHPTVGDIVRFPNEYFNYSWIADTSVTITPGKTYKVEALFVSSPPGLTRPQFMLTLRDSTNEPTGAFFERVTVSIREDEPISETFTVPDDWPASQNIPHVVVYANNFTGERNDCQYVRIFELPDAFAASELDGLSLEQYMREVLEKRGGKAPADWSSADAAAIDTATGYEVGYYTDRAVSILDALLAVTDAWGISYHTDPDGVLRVTRLTDPADVAEVDLDGEVSDYNLLAAVELEPDTAEGLTTAMAVRRNWQAYDPADFGDTTFVDVNQATRRALMRTHQEVVTTGVDLPGMYQHAALAEPVETALDRPADAQAELGRVCEIYSTPRWIYVIELPEPAGTRYQIGQVLKLTESQHGLSEGKQVLVLAEEHQVFDEWVRLVVWG